VGMTPSSSGQGYWMVASDGGIFAFGDAPFLGSTGGNTPARVVSITSTDQGNSLLQHDPNPGGDPYPAGAIGYDISYPQCATTTKAASIPPSGSQVPIVGVNDGLSPHDAVSNDQPDFNPCFTQQAAWAGPNLSTYINVDNLTDETSTAEATSIGSSDAISDIEYMVGQGVRPEFVWLDVEEPCNVTSEPLWQCGAAGQAMNAAMIQGVVSTLQANGFNAGIYSTYLQWPGTAGSAQFPGLPIWIAGAGGVANFSGYCTDATKTFAGGTPYLVQWAGGGGQFGNPTAWDEDYSCPA
jgi:hypothetical protein